MAAFGHTGSLNMAFLEFVLTVVAVFSSQIGANVLDPSLIARELRIFADDGLGADELQAYFNRLQYTQQTIDGNKLTPELALKLKDKFKTRFDVAERLRQAVQDSYNKPPRNTTAKECCHVDKSTLVYDERFRSKVDLNNICLKISGSAPRNPRHLHTEEVLKVMKEIFKQYPFIKWQYFGSEEGVMTNFPVYDDQDPCPRYDPRYRPFYVETATPKAKDVVLIIDTSASMVGDRMKVAKEAAKLVLETMNPKDQIGVVSFNNEASTNEGNGVSPCYSQRLALAVPANKNSLEKYVDGLNGGGASIYQVAFEKACALLKASASDETTPNKKRVILFLTDGEPNDGNISSTFKIIRDCNSELNNSIIIFTYGIGTANAEILADIAKQNTSKYGFPRDISQGKITSGKYTYVTTEDINTLRIKMATYYNFLPPERLDHPVVSVPYIDAFGTGLLMSITLPCYDNKGNFIGVAGTDINIEDLLSDITFFNQGQTTYAFMISGTGRTLIHPLLPAPNDAYADPIFMDVRTLEPDSEFNEVFYSMTKGLSGSKTYQATRYLLRGGDRMDGVTMRKLESTYVWSPVERTEFSVGVVTPVSYHIEVLRTLQIPEGYSFKYHRIDLDPPQNPCLHFGQVVTNVTTVVKFAPGAFLDPYAYIGANETKVDVQLLDNYMMGNQESEHSKLKRDIRDTVIATWKVENLWLRDKAALTQYLVWRYIGTANGVFRTTPGHAIPKTYDPRQRPWYHTALSHSGFITLTTPYLDMGGAGEVITMARSIYRGESSDNVLGVVGADFPLRYFYRLLTKVYPRCAQTNTFACFVMDTAGFLIMHEEFLLSSTKAPDLEHVHITQKEKHIAEDLIKKGYLIKRECRSLEELRKRSFYEVNLPARGVDQLSNGQPCKYELGRISGTNVYLGGVVRDAFCTSESCPCASDNECPFLNVSCECPCTSSTDFHYCRSQFPKSSVPICPAILPAEQPDNTERKVCLPKCFDPHCQERNNSQLCDGLVSCYWCQKDKDNLPLTKPYCGSFERCFRGKESPVKTTEDCSPVLPNGKQPSERDGLSVGAIVGIPIGCVLFFLVIVLVFFVIRHYRNSADPPVRKDTSASMQNIALNPVSSSSLPDVLRPNHNQGFYDEIGQKSDFQNQGPPSYNEIQHFATTPGYPGNGVNDSEPPPPPVPDTKRPPLFGMPRPRSQTDINPPAQAHKTRRPSDYLNARSSSQRITNSANHPRPRGSPNGAATSVTRLPSHSEVNSQQPLGFSSQKWDPSRTDICFKRHRPAEDSPPPPLQPRSRKTSEASNAPLPTGPAQNERTLYSNVSTVPEAGEGPSFDMETAYSHENDDVDDDGYVTCVRS